MELAVAKDGRVFYVERITGEVKVIKPDGTVLTAGVIPVSSVQENGLLGIALDPNFDANHNVYVAYTPLPDSSTETRVARFTLNGDTLDTGLASRSSSRCSNQRTECCHSSGSLAFGLDGSLYLSTGDNTNPFASDGFDPIDERAGPRVLGRPAHVGQHELLQRQDPAHRPAREPDGSGRRHGLHDPDRQPVQRGRGHARTRRCPRSSRWASAIRSGSRSTRYSGKVLMGDYGPDASATNPNRGPQGSVEYNVVTPGYYGWPYCVRDNVPYNDYDFATGTSGPKFNCAAPVNNSPNNTGLTNLPPAKPAVGVDGLHRDRRAQPGPRHGRRPDGRPALQVRRRTSNSDTKFPAFYDKQWFIGEWNNGWIKTATLNADESAVTNVATTPWQDTFARVHEMEFGPDGSLYVIDWGSGFNGNNADSGIFRIDYIKGARRPIAHAAVDKDNGPVPLAVQFSSAGSVDPEGTSLTYAWDFDGNGTTDSTAANPTHTYTTAGNYNVKLTVTDQAGMTGTDTLTVIAGNTRPTVKIDFPEDGQFADFGDTIPYKITVTDPEDGTIDCSKVSLNIQLGHDEHAHPLQTKQGCEGTFQTASDSGHDPNMNIFTSIVATYTDKGNGAAQALTGQDDVVLHTRRKRAEHNNGTGRVRRLHRRRRPGRAGGGHPGRRWRQQRRVHRERRLHLLQPDELQGPHPDRLPRGLRRRGRQDRAADGLADRRDVRLGRRRADGRLAELDDGLRAADQPAAGHARALLRVHAPDRRRRPDEPQLVPGPRQGRRGLRAAGRDRDGHAGDRPGAARRSKFNATATDPEGEALTYLWDFGVTGTTTDTSTQEDPTYTYVNAGTYTAKVTVTDAQGIKGTATVNVRVTGAPNQCDQNAKSDEFNGTALDLNRWTVRRSLNNISVDRRRAGPADRQRLDLPGRHERRQHHHPADAERHVDRDRQGPRRRAQPELPAGRPARVLRRRQLGVGAHDLRGRRAPVRVHLRERGQPAQRGGRPRPACCPATRRWPTTSGSTRTAPTSRRPTRSTATRSRPSAGRRR